MSSELSNQGAGKRDKYTFCIGVSKNGTPTYALTPIPLTISKDMDAIALLMAYPMGQVAIDAVLDAVEKRDAKEAAAAFDAPVNKPDPQAAKAAATALMGRLTTAPKAPAESAAPTRTYKKRASASASAFPKTGFVRLWQILGSESRKNVPFLPISRKAWNEGVASGRFPKGERVSERITLWKAEDIRSLKAVPQSELDARSPQIGSIFHDAEGRN